MQDPKARFSSRVENYVKYRPGYPPAVIDLLRAECGLGPGSVIADIGSGTGLLAGLFLAAGCRVYGVEPNPEMRAAGERLLSGYPLFESVDGSAEATGLPAESVDFASAGQAFHWFDPPRARSEFFRILRPGGWVVLAWNERQLDSTPFLRGYEALLQTYATDYNDINHRNVEEDPNIVPDFYGGPYQVANFENIQVFDYAGVRGRMLSSSYVPEEGHPNYQPMLDALEKLFEQHQQAGKVAFEYNTSVMYGRFA